MYHESHELFIKDRKNTCSTFPPVSQSLRTILSHSNMSTAIPSNRYASSHTSPSGPGDARPTAAQIIADNDLVGALSGKIFLVTGGSSGLGVDIVRQLAKTGASVFFTSRDASRGEKVKGGLVAEAKAEGREVRIEVLEMECGSLASVRGAAEAFRKRADGLNVLVNNAGVCVRSYPPGALGAEADQVFCGL